MYFETRSAKNTVSLLNPRSFIIYGEFPPAPCLRPPASLSYAPTPLSITRLTRAKQWLPNLHLFLSGLKLRVTIGCWCVTLEVLLLRSNLFAPHAPYAKKYASCVSPIYISRVTKKG